MSVDASARMAPRVTFVGGLDRLARDLMSLGDELGVEVRVHDGDTRGHGGARLTAMLQRTDVVVLVTGVISHGAVHLAKRDAQKVGAELVILRSCGLSTARQLLETIACRASTARRSA